MPELLAMDHSRWEGHREGSQGGPTPSASFIRCAIAFPKAIFRFHLAQLCYMTILRRPRKWVFSFYSPSIREKGLKMGIGLISEQCLSQIRNKKSSFGLIDSLNIGKIKNTLINCWLSFFVYLVVNTSLWVLLGCHELWLVSSSF